MMAAVAGLMLGSYYLAYVITPFDIAWHVSTSIDRLLVQLWPLLVLTAFGGSRAVGEFYKEDPPNVVTKTE
jgi:hypothetical protein